MITLERKKAQINGVGIATKDGLIMGWAAFYNDYKKCPVGGVAILPPDVGERSI